MVYLILSLGLVALSAVLRVASLFRLTVPLIYALVVPTVFSDWYYANQPLAEGIWYGMLVLVVFSWVVSIIRKIQDSF